MSDQHFNDDHDARYDASAEAHEAGSDSQSDGYDDEYVDYEYYDDFDDYEDAEEPYELPQSDTQAAVTDPDAEVSGPIAGEAPLVEVEHSTYDDMPVHVEEPVEPHFRAPRADEDVAATVDADDDRSIELQSILAQINEPTEGPRDDRDALASADSFDAADDFDDEGFAMGDASFIDDEPELAFCFGDEDEDVEDAESIPMTTDEFEARTNPGLAEERKASAGESAFARISDGMGNIFDIAAERARRVKLMLQGSGSRRRQQVSSERKRQIVVGLMVAIVVFGIGYAIFSGGDGDEGESVATDEATASAAAESQDESESSPPEYELVRLGDDDSDGTLDDAPMVETGAAAAASATPSNHTPQPGGSAVDKPFQEQNVMLPSAVPAAPKKHKLTRPCVLRKGPASRFPMISPLDPGHVLEVYTRSTGDWESIEVDGVRGWGPKGCQNGAGCTLRMGPGEKFRPVYEGDNSPRPTSRVISSSRWRYVKFGKLFGWTGPACFK